MTVKRISLIQPINGLCIVAYDRRYESFSSETTSPQTQARSCWRQFRQDPLTTAPHLVFLSLQWSQAFFTFSRLCPLVALEPVEVVFAGVRGICSG